jgi:hypothetical protein
MGGVGLPFDIDGTYSDETNAFAVSAIPHLVVTDDTVVFTDKESESGFKVIDDRIWVVKAGNEIRAIEIYGQDDSPRYKISPVDLDERSGNEFQLELSSSIYGSGGGTNQSGIVLVRVDEDSIRQIFAAITHCDEESFGDRLNNGEGRYHAKVEHEVAIKEKHLYISPLDSSHLNLSAITNACVTPLQEGKYRWNGRKLERAK